MGSSSSEDETVVRDMRWDDYVNECYSKLKKGLLMASESDFSFRCPFCCRKKRTKYSCRELLRHAYGHGRGSPSAEKTKKKARHVALEKYADKYFGNKSSKISSTNEAESSQGDQPKIITTSTPKPHVNREISKLDSDTDPNKKIVWPWFGVLANLPVEVKEGRLVMESNSKIRDDLARQGFCPLKVHALWSHNGASGFALVDFGKDLAGLANAIKFERSFEAQLRGKRDWKCNGHRQKGGHIYGWIAKLDDFESRHIVGNNLRKLGDITTIEQKEAEDQRKNTTLVEKLVDTFEDKAVNIKEMEGKYNETASLLKKIMAEKDKIIEDYNKSMSEMEQRRRDEYKKIILDHERSRANLAARKKELIQKEKALDRLEDQFESVKEKILREKEMNDRATLEQDQADEKVFLLAEQQKRELEALHQRMLELESKLDAIQVLELEIKQLEGSQRVMGENAEVTKKIEALKEELEEKNEELDSINELNQVLINKERSSNDELQSARLELIRALKDVPVSLSLIGVKRMGELDGKIFHAATKRKYSTEEEAAEKAVSLCLFWEDKLRDPSWHPFKIIIVNGNEVEVFDEEDELLKQVREEAGEEAWEGVKTAMLELNEYNPSGRCPVPELWHQKENRRATLKEGAAFILRQLRLRKKGMRC